MRLFFFFFFWGLTMFTVQWGATFFAVNLLIQAKGIFRTDSWNVAGQKTHQVDHLQLPNSFMCYTDRRCVLFGLTSIKKKSAELMSFDAGGACFESVEFLFPLRL